LFSTAHLFWGFFSTFFYFFFLIVFCLPLFFLLFIVVYFLFLFVCYTNFLFLHLSVSLSYVHFVRSFSLFILIHKRLAVVRFKDEYRIVAESGSWGRFRFKVDAEEAAFRVAARAPDQDSVELLVQDAFGELLPLRA